MDRRRYLASLSGLAALGVAGCTGRSSPGTPDSGDPSSTTPTETPTATESPPAEPPVTLTAGDHAVTISNPRVRALVRRAGVHVDVYATPDAQFLRFDVETSHAAVEDLSLSMASGETTVANRLTEVGRTASDRRGELALSVPVTGYASLALVLEADGDTARWRLPDRFVEALSMAPDFHVEALEAPETVGQGEAFDASFTVSNRGDRDGHFLAEFGHTLISDTGEVELDVPVGESRTHAQQIGPVDWGDHDVIPVVLDWGLVRRRVDVTVERG